MQFDDEKLWSELLTFKYHEMIAMKNLDNDLPTESWDSLFHTGFFIALSALRLKRLKDKRIAEELESTLKVILENGVTFRGFNSPGEYWSGHAMDKYYPIWHDKEVFGDVSRDQIISLIFGLYFIHVFIPKEFVKIHKLKNEIVKTLFDKFESLDYNLGTTYGDCRTFQVPFRLFFDLINSDETFSDKSISDERYRSEDWNKSVKYLKWAPIFLRFIKLRLNYFSNNLINLLLFLFFSSLNRYSIHTNRNLNSIIPTRRIAEIKKSYRNWIKKRRNDNNLFFELCYYYATGEYICERDFMTELNEIFKKMPDKKIQDFIWQRHPKDWYNPRWGKNVTKNFYAPWHDYLLVFEMIKNISDSGVR